MSGEFLIKGIRYARKKVRITHPHVPRILIPSSTVSIDIWMRKTKPRMGHESAPEFLGASGCQVSSES